MVARGSAHVSSAIRSGGMVVTVAEDDDEDDDEEEAEGDVAHDGSELKTMREPISEALWKADASRRTKSAGSGS